MTTALRALGAGISLALLPTLSAGAETLNYAYGYPESSAVGLAAVRFADEVSQKTGGELTVQPFSMSLLSLSETGPGLRDGMADIGYVLTPYYSAEYATSLFLHELNPLVNLGPQDGTAPLAYTGAILEYTLTKCPECLSEFAAQNQVYTGGGVTTLYGLQCTQPVASIADLKGKRVRTAGAGFVRFAEHFGAVGVPLPVNEVYEALSQGVLDCAMLSAPELTNYNLTDVVTDITPNIPGGLFAGVASTNVNRDVWQRLTVEEREAVLWGASQMTAGITWNFVTQEAEAMAAAEAKGISIHQPDEASQASVREFVEADLQTAAAIFRDTYGVARVDEIAADFPQMLEKWRGLVSGVDSHDALQKLLWDQVYSKIDPATYGL
ncbi:C4-dicarboxylate TRAP transporter substrate-binding protein [Paracoccus zhejiangensis]|uniref:C4-dicarboxylate ABC transporter substrate-binding protein n=1 Tax=Paracoccus zhejiangensis TaxID=1077935 RepID=A0A2H5EVN1_9RHOB|nr:C4-dicarboxylate TRAP transporter substrate-binding protein [Paracoccus zhejiangensis]AUH63344.1 C4-dicarboxylate ABC transporter substrate-binding protein [Paracoccus zhejiangensis]